MLDLETMGTYSNAAIVAIGAVKFGPEGIEDRYYAAVDLQSCLNVGLSVTGPTIDFWLRQPDKARNALLENKWPLDIVLDNFAEWVGKDAIIWGNGAPFDNSILASAYRACTKPQPWKFWNDRCYRTIKNIAPEIRIERIGVHHNALNDAESQALHLINIAAAHGLRHLWANE